MVRSPSTTPTRSSWANIAKRLAEGAAVTGHKVGLSAKAMQRMLGVNEPDYGHLLDTMFAFENAELAVDRLLQPRVEIEVAFVLKARLEGPGVSVADVIRATDFVLPAIEVVDSRIADWKIALADTIADNASSGMVVLGGSPSRLDELDIRRNRRLTAVQRPRPRGGRVGRGPWQPGRGGGVAGE